MLKVYQTLKTKFGTRSDPDTWWPIYFGRTDPRAFERVLTNVIVTQTQWPMVRRAVEALDQAGLLTAQAIARAPLDMIAVCLKPTGFQARKAATIQAVSVFVVEQFQTEAAFCANVTAAQLQGIAGIGPETADRILLYTCMRLAFPVDTYCFRVLAHHQIIPAEPTKMADKRTIAAHIKQMVGEQIPPNLEDWQRLHALMQLEGEDLRKKK